MAVGDITSLPKWAQQEFARVNMRLQEAEAANVILQGEYPKSRVQVGFDEVYLPDNRSIYFRTGENEHEKIGVRVKDGKLDINGYGGRIAILPTSSNSAEIELIDRFR